MDRVGAVIVHDVNLFMPCLIIGECDPRMRDPRLAGQLESELIGHQMRQTAGRFRAALARFSLQDFAAVYLQNTALQGPRSPPPTHPTLHGHVSALPAPS